MTTPAGVRFFAIAPTVFHEDGSVDGEAVAQNVARIQEYGVRGVLLTGSYGEFQVLTGAERAAVTEAVVRHAPDMVLMSGAAALNTASAIEIGEQLFAAGAHQVMVSAPFAAELTETDLHTHFAEVGSALGHDLVVYNNPVFGVDLSPNLLAEITESEAYTGVKQGTKLLAAMVDTVTRVQAPGNAQVFAAADLACAAAIGAGVAGVTSTNVWVFPEVFLALADPAVAPERKAQLLTALRPYADLVRQLGQPRSVKAAMGIRGYVGSAHVRSPYVPLDDVESKRMAEAIAEVDDRLTGIGS